MAEFHELQMLYVQRLTTKLYNKDYESHKIRFSYKT